MKKQNQSHTSTSPIDVKWVPTSYEVGTHFTSIGEALVHVAFDFCFLFDCSKITAIDYNKHRGSIRHPGSDQPTPLLYSTFVFKYDQNHTPEEG